MKKKILVVEKDEDILQIILHVLLEEGYTVKTSLTETNIFDQIITYMPDAILLDIIKPTETGTALCRAIKATEHTKHIPIIVLSTHLKLNAVKQVCADEVLAKPFNISELVDIIEKQLVV